MSENNTPVVSQKKLITQTMFGMGRKTLYLLLPAFGAIGLYRYMGVDNDSVRIGLLLCAFVFSWVCIGLDYVYIMRRVSVTDEKKDSVDQSRTPTL